MGFGVSGLGLRMVFLRLFESLMGLKRMLLKHSLAFCGLSMGASNGFQGLSRKFTFQERSRGSHWGCSGFSRFLGVSGVLTDIREFQWRLRGSQMIFSWFQVISGTFLKVSRIYMGASGGLMGFPGAFQLCFCVFQGLSGRVSGLLGRSRDLRDV